MRVGGAPVRTLAPEDSLLFLCAHGTKHLWERLGWICDVAQLLRRARGVDLDAVLQQARALGAERMVLLGLRLAADLLDAPLADGVRSRLAAERASAHLSAQLRARLFRHIPGAPIDPWAMRLYHLRALQCWHDRVRYCGRVALVPTPADWAWLPVPDTLYPLYYAVRPVRLVWKYALRGLRAVPRV